MWTLRITLCLLVIGGGVLPPGNARGEKETATRHPEALKPLFERGMAADIRKAMSGADGKRWMASPADVYVLAALCRVHASAFAAREDKQPITQLLRDIESWAAMLQQMHPDSADTHRARAEVLWAEARILHPALWGPGARERFPAAPNAGKPPDTPLTRAAAHAVAAARLKSAHHASHVTVAARLLLERLRFDTGATSPRELVEQALALFVGVDKKAADVAAVHARVVATWLRLSDPKATTMPDGTPLADAAARASLVLARAAMPGKAGGEVAARDYNRLVPVARERGWGSPPRYLSRTAFSRWGYLAFDLPRGGDWVVTREGAENTTLMTTITARDGEAAGTTIRLSRYNLQQRYPVGPTRLIEGNNIQGLLDHDLARHREVFERGSSRKPWSLAIRQPEAAGSIKARGYALVGRLQRKSADARGRRHVYNAMWLSERHQRVFAVEVVVPPGRNHVAVTDLLASLREEPPSDDLGEQEEE